MVEGWHPNRRETDTLLSVLKPHFGKEEWREVIPLAAVLGEDPRGPSGRAYAVLRESRMPAVVCQPVQADVVRDARIVEDLQAIRLLGLKRLVTNRDKFRRRARREVFNLCQRW